MTNKFDFVSDMNSLEEYLKSSKNIKICEPFQRECQRFTKIAEEYKNKASCLCNLAEEKVVREEYSVKGEVLHRGYYSPSPIIDIVIGNCNRGKLLKRLTTSSKVVFSYGFDRLNRLILVKNKTDDSISTTEVIEYYQNIALGITFSPDFLITQICEEIYEDNKIMFLSQASFAAGSRIFNLHHEAFTYGSLGIRSSDFYIYNPDMPLLQHQQYHFQHDDEGYLSKYTVTEFQGESVWEDHVFDVRIKRKI
ncbi:hypothetical protein [Caproiciproducens sp. CPB-2]|uniref:hypothetical protein n=1 Tax=Caproiciproducens sp. CPB-2 TaxID=3030017 RepID=UPI0023DCE65C|nr:hypothetical protein [Caproiciproducens sp. CPB-2]MDF1494828.1 hypothetical protein [Caproiciproducens sp. CPB-2]